MEKMYQDYRDIAEFRLIYIREAHAADSSWPMPIAKEKGINEHTSYEDRCKTAEMLINDNSLTIPTLIDEMDNVANDAYRAWPDRVFLIRSDGRLAVAAKRGPFGFEPGLKESMEWLKTFRESGTEPPLSEDVIEAAEKRAAEKADVPEKDG